MRMWSPKVPHKGGVQKAPLSSQGANKPFRSANSRRPFSNASKESEEAGVSVQDDSLSLPAILPTDTSSGGVDKHTNVAADISFPTYTITNLTYDRTYNANGSSVGELADVLGTLIRDVRTMLNELNRRARDAGTSGR